MTDEYSAPPTGPRRSPAVGDRLENGAEILEIKPGRNNPTLNWVVICRWDHDGMTEYVTWRLHPLGDGRLRHYWGRYFADLESARDDYKGMY